MLIIRSCAFNIVFFTVLALGLIVGIPFRFFDKKYTFTFWSVFSTILQRVASLVGGINCKFEGEENIPAEPAIYAFRHESMWETMMLIYRFHQPVFILKKELLNVPLFGLMAKKSGAIGIDRKDGVKALIKATREVSQAIAENHDVIIFPEGTRAHSGEHIPIKRGISLFYQKNNCPIIPVVHNAGRFWPRRGFIKRPGTITVKFLKPILPGLSHDEFMEVLNDVFYREIEKLKSLEG